MNVWVGADWDRDKCVVAYELDGRRQRATVERTPASVEAFVARFDGHDVVVGIEVGDRLWAALWRRVGAVVFVFDGKKARRFSESLSVSGARDDRRSAEHLLDMVKSERHRAAANPELTSELSALLLWLDTREDAVSEATRHGQRLLALLRQHHPAFARTLRTVDANWVVRLVAEAPTPGAWRELADDVRGRLLKGTSKAKRTDYARALGDDYGVLSAAEEEAVRARIRSQVRLFAAAREARVAASKALDEALSESATGTTLQENDGIGSVLGGGLTIALDHARDHGRGRDGAAVLLAVVPVTIRSGVRGDRRPLVAMRRSTQTLMRKNGHLLGAQLVTRYRWAKAQFAFYKSHGKRTFSAYRRIARSFLRIARALLRDGTQFDEARYIAGLKAKGVTWAHEL